MKKSVVALSALLFAVSFSVSAGKNKIDKEAWGQYQANAQHTGYMPIKVKVKKIKKSWSSDVSQSKDGTKSYRHNPATVKSGTVIVTSSNLMKAINEKNGEVLWEQKYDWHVQPNSISDDTVYVQTVNNSIGGTALRAYDLKTGQLKYAEPFTAQWQSYNAPVIDGDYIYAGAGYLGGFNKYNKETGEKICYWEAPTLSETTTAALNKEYLVYYSAGNLYTINKDTCETVSAIKDERWSWNGYDDPTPVLDTEDTALVPFKGNLSRYDLGSGKVDYNLTGISGVAAVDGSNIYVVKDNYLSSINKKTGETNWIYQDKSYASGLKGIVLSKNLIIFSDNVGTYALDKNGKEVKWAVLESGKLSLTNSGLYIVSDEGMLTKYSL